MLMHHAAAESVARSPRSWGNRTRVYLAYGEQGARLMICGFPKLLASAFFRAAVAGALALAMHGAGAQDRPAETKVRLVVGGKSAIFYLPLSVTERLGYF